MGRPEGRKARVVLNESGETLPEHDRAAPADGATPPAVPSTLGGGTGTFQMFFSNSQG